MSGLPGLTETKWESFLEAAVDAGPHHLSVYDLQIEEHTPFAKQYRPGVSPLPSDEAAASMYATASLVLRNSGYEHYEISNYGRAGHRCRHNMTYWEGGQYYAFGMGAASYLQGRRFSRPRRLGAYLKWLQELEAKSAEESNAGRPVIPGEEAVVESAEDRLTDTIMLRLRLADGLDLEALRSDFVDGADVVDVILEAVAKHSEQGRAMIETSSADGKTATRIRLTDPEGFLVSNDVISDIFASVEEAKRG